jgi:hypothetical protein
VLTDDEQRFFDNYKRNLPLDDSPSVMNRICWAVERETDGLSFLIPSEYSCYNLRTGVKYSKDTYDVIKMLCDGYRNVVKKESKNILSQNENSADFAQNTAEVLEYYVKEMYAQCSNEETLCDILIDLCYDSSSKISYSKDIVWAACGNVIVDRLLKLHEYKMRYPVKSDNPDFICCGTGFEMCEIVCKDGADDEFFV